MTLMSLGGAGEPGREQGIDAEFQEDAEAAEERGGEMSSKFESLGRSQPCKLTRL